MRTVGAIVVPRDEVLFGYPLHFGSPEIIDIQVTLDKCNKLSIYVCVVCVYNNNKENQSKNLR